MGNYLTDHTPENHPCYIMADALRTRWLSMHSLSELEKQFRDEVALCHNYIVEETGMERYPLPLFQSGQVLYFKEDGNG